MVKKTFLWQTLTVGAELGFTIAVPLVILLLVGRFLDRHFHTSPIFLLIGLIVSFVFSFYGLHKVINPVLKDSNKEDKKTTKPH